jgi:hypothetical protein
VLLLERCDVVAMLAKLFVASPSCAHMRKEPGAPLAVYRPLRRYVYGPIDLAQGEQSSDSQYWSLAMRLNSALTLIDFGSHDAMT